MIFHSDGYQRKDAHKLGGVIMSVISMALGVEGIKNKRKLKQLIKARDDLQSSIARKTALKEAIESRIKTIRERVKGE